MSFVKILLEKLRASTRQARRYALTGAQVGPLQPAGSPASSAAEDAKPAVSAAGGESFQFGYPFDLNERWRTLSQREQEVTALLCLGYTNRQIAEKLFIAPDTVRTHMRHILYKFDLHSKDDLRLLLIDWNFDAWD